MKNPALSDFSEIAFRVTDNTNAMLAYWDKDLICRFANKAYVDWFGVDPASMVNKMHIKDLLGPVLYQKNLKYIEGALNGNAQVFERELTTPSGEVRNSIANYYPDISGKKVKGFFVHVADVTPIKKNIPEPNPQLQQQDTTELVERTLRAMLPAKFPGLTELAKKHFISVSKLKRDFKKKYHTTIGEYYRFLQMEFADEYLSENRFSKKQMADLLGFSNHSNFSAAYRKYVHAKNEQALNKTIKTVTNENYRAFISQSPCALAMFDVDMNFLAASQLWVNLNELQNNPLEGKNIYDIFPTINKRWKNIYNDCLKGNIHTGEGLFSLNRQTPRYLKWDVRPWYDGADIGGVLIFIEDLSEFKRIESENKSKNQILSKAGEIAHIGTWERNIITNIATWDNVTRQILEISDDYDINAAPLNFYKEGASRTRARKHVQLAMQKGKTFDFLAEIITAKGNTKKARIIGYPETVNNTCVKICGIIQELPL